MLLIFAEKQECKRQDATAYTFPSTTKLHPDTFVHVFC